MNKAEIKHLTIGDQVLSAAGLIGMALLSEPSLDERAKLIASAIRVMAVAIDGTDAYGALHDAADKIEAQANINLEPPEDHADAMEWAAQREAEKNRGRA